MSGPTKNTMMGAVIHSDRRSVKSSGAEGTKEALFPALELKEDLPLPDPSGVRDAIGDEAYEALVNCGEGGEAGGELRLIKVLRAGICGTDIHMLKGYVDDAVAVDGKSPLILGHEFVGIDTKTSERVVAGINIPCGRCPLCHRAAEEGGEDLLVRRRNHCPHRHCIGIHQWSGCHAEYLLAPSGNLFKVPQSLTDLEACCTEPLAAALRIVEQGIVKSNDRVCIVGGGRLGLMVAEVMMRLPLARRVACGIQEEGGVSELCVIGTDVDRMRHVLSLPKAASTTEEQHCYRAVVNCPNGRPMLVKLVSRYCPDCATASIDSAEPNLFDVVVECTGSSSYAAAFNNALNLCRKMGTVVMKTTASADEAPPTDPALALGSLMTRCVVDEMKLMGSRCGPMGAGLRFIEEAKEEPNDLRPAPMASEALPECDACKSVTVSYLPSTPAMHLDHHIGAVLPLSEAVQAYTLAAVHHSQGGVAGRVQLVAAAEEE